MKYLLIIPILVFLPLVVGGVQAVILAIQVGWEIEDYVLLSWVVIACIPVILPLILLFIL